MKRWNCMLLLLIALFLLTACNAAYFIPEVEVTPPSEVTQAPEADPAQAGALNLNIDVPPVRTPDASVDIDLAALSGIMAYSEVFNMMDMPAEYLGKRVKIAGTFSFYQDSITGKEYFSCMIADATVCCTQGLEFVLAGEPRYPDDYPADGSPITVTGTFDTYVEDDFIYCRLIDAVLSAA